MVPNKKYIMWLPNDGFPGCYCKNCSKLIDWDAPRTQRHERLLWGYVKRLCADVQKRWPGKTVSTLLYGGINRVPPDIELPKNLLLCKVWNSAIEPLMKEEKYWKMNMREVDQVNKFSNERMLIWSHYPIKPYDVTKEPMPANAPHVLQRIYQENRDKIGGVVLNGGYLSVAQNGQTLYLYYKILWNPDIDVDAQLAEFCRLQFGPGGDDMLTFFTCGINRWEKTKWSYLPDGERRQVIRAIPSQLYWEETYPPAARKQMQQHLEDAVAKTQIGSMYNVKATYYRDAHKPFFKLGVFKDNFSRPTFTCPKTTRPIKIDGDLTEWKGAKPLILKNNVTGEPVKVKTEIYTAFDGKTFYVAGRVHEPDQAVLPPKPVARDSHICDYDSVEIFFCSDQEGFEEASIAKTNQYHQFMINARGELLDGYKSTKDRSSEKKVNFDIQYKVKPMGNGFQFEMAFPYKAIHTLIPKPGDHWFVNFYRNRPRKDGSPRNHAYAPTTLAFNDTAKFALMKFPGNSLLNYDFENKKMKFGVWQKRSPAAKCTQEIKNGTARLRVTYPKTEKANARIVFTISGIGMKVDKPIQTSYTFRYRGKGLKSLQFSLSSKNHSTQVVKFSPLHTPEKKVDVKKWKTLMGDRVYRYIKSKKTYLKFPPDIHKMTVGMELIPGTDVVIELDEIRVETK